MSAPVLDGKLSPDSDAFRANAAINRALAEELRTKVGEAARGGSARAREKHEARGKLLPRERVERLLDAGSPFLEIGQLAADRKSVVWGRSGFGRGDLGGGRENKKKRQTH